MRTSFTPTSGMGTSSIQMPFSGSFFTNAFIVLCLMDWLYCFPIANLHFFVSLQKDFRYFINCPLAILPRSTGILWSCTRLRLSIRTHVCIICLSIGGIILFSPPSRYGQGFYSLWPRQHGGSVCFPNLQGRQWYAPPSGYGCRLGQKVAGVPWPCAGVRCSRCPKHSIRADAFPTSGHLQCTPWMEAKRWACMLRALSTRSRMTELGSPGAAVEISWNERGSISHCMSMRSSKGPLILLR